MTYQRGLRRLLKRSTLGKAENRLESVLHFGYLFTIDIQIPKPKEKLFHEWSKLGKVMVLASHECSAHDTYRLYLSTLMFESAVSQLLISTNIS